LLLARPADRHCAHSDLGRDGTIRHLGVGLHRFLGARLLKPFGPPQFVFTFGPFGKRRWSYLVLWSESGISEKSKNGWQLAKQFPDDLTAQHIRELSPRFGELQ
jgi:hypothetical protein